ncbi:MAG: Gfo/Idh/MocA family protein [Imperialibacter sp.]|uniref:Gfo/Idh/MocA family protein n=1 Tax=Imperialibacter sp. TaxID=2038411 RepID=UPI003A86FED8
MSRKIRMGMVGGGRGAFIGAIHRHAAGLDGQVELVCGAFHIDPEISVASGKDFYLPEDRCYRTYHEMFEKEAKLPADKRMDFVTIVTPNFVHFEPAKLALENGYHVVCEKPLSFSLDEALQLEALVKKTGLTFAVTHTYTGYPMVKQAREMIKEGVFGKIRKVVVEYPQGWLSTPLEQSGNQQASWRTDPKRSGKAGAVGDIGTHAENLAETITGLKITELCADVSRMVSGRLLDDDANILLRFDNGAKGVLHCSQIAAGEENALNIRVYGEKGGLEWHQMEPNTMLVKWLDKPTQVYRVGGDRAYMGAVAQANTRTPAGHPEGYLEAFGNIYKNFAKTVQARIDGKKPDPVNLDFPTVEDGVRGMKFIDAVIESGDAGAKWVKLN